MKQLIVESLLALTYFNCSKKKVIFRLYIKQSTVLQLLLPSCKLTVKFQVPCPSAPLLRPPLCINTDYLTKIQHVGNLNDIYHKFD